MGAARRALFLTHEPPLPAVSGTRVRSLNLMRELHRRGWRLSLFSLSDGSGPGEAVRVELEQLCERAVIEPFRRSGVAQRLRAAAGLLRRRPVPEWFFCSPALRKRFRAAYQPQAFDVVMTEGLWMHPYLEPSVRGRAVLDCHNLEAPRVEAMAATLGARPRGLAARFQAPALRRYEAEAVRGMGCCLAVSEEEAQALVSLGASGVHLVPNGIDPAAYPSRARVTARPELLFIGALDYGPNDDAVRFMCESILPLVTTPAATLTLVGRGADRLRGALARAPVPIEVAGEVATTQPYLQRARLFVAPLRYGGGTRLKIIEAMASGLAVITTTAGCEGLDVRHEREMAIADEPEEFAAWIDRLLRDDELCARLGRAARATAESRYDWRRIGDALEPALGELIRGHD
jgi:glycosyltransferase involved in cell wall biosynthesis